MLRAADLQSVIAIDIALVASLDADSNSQLEYIQLGGRELE